MRATVRTAVVASVLAAACVLAGSFASSASAGCAGYNRCYGLAEFYAQDAGFYTGGLAQVTVYRMSDEGGTAFALSGITVCDPQLFADGTNCNTWTEAGVTRGKRVTGSNRALSGYWAEQDGGGCNGAQYLEYYPLSMAYSLYQTFNFKISYNNNYQHAIYMTAPGSPSHFIDNTAMCHANQSGVIETGSEANETSEQVTADSWYLQKRASDGSSWSYYWPGSVIANKPAGGPEYTNWYSGYQDYAAYHYQN